MRPNQNRTCGDHTSWLGLIICEHSITQTDLSVHITMIVYCGVGCGSAFPSCFEVGCTLDNHQLVAGLTLKRFTLTTIPTQIDSLWESLNCGWKAECPLSSIRGYCNILITEIGKSFTNFLVCRLYQFTLYFIFTQEFWPRVACALVIYTCFFGRRVLVVDNGERVHLKHVT